MPGSAALYHRAKLNGAARFGRYTDDMERGDFAEVQQT